MLYYVKKVKINKVFFIFFNFEKKFKITIQDIFSSDLINFRKNKENKF